MPRFDKEGFNPDIRIGNDEKDRNVPLDELFSNSDDIDLSAFQRSSKKTNNDLFDEFDLEPPQRSNRQKYPEENINKPSKKRKPPKEKQNKRSGKKSPLSIILFALIALLLIGSLLANSALNRITYDDKISNQYVASNDLKSSGSVKNILLLGVDARNEEDDTKSRADSMMLISIDSKNHCVKMTSFLRDTWVYIPAHNGEQRLNAACTYGGYSGVVNTIEYNFGVDIDGYVVADFNMFQILVDSVGGVEVEVTKKEAKEVTKHKKRYGNVKLKSGKQLLDGKQALAYCRIRKIDTDFKRTKRQRTVMSAILNKVKKSNPITLYKMLYNAAPYIETDLSKVQLVSYGLKGITCISKMVQTRVPFEHTWRYATIRGNSVISIDTEKNKEELISYIYEKTPSEIEEEQSE